MRYRLLGRSGLRVSELCLGTMSFGERWGFGADAATSERLVAAYLDAGGNFIDGANKYHEGQSEEIVGRAIAGRRPSVVLATKYTLAMNADDPNAAGNHRKNLVQSIEASLERLQTDYLDLLWLHAWDFTTPIDEVMRALDDLVRQGKVLYIGVSDTPAWVVSAANTMADLRGWTRFVGLQVEYSLMERTVERELIPMARAMGLSVTPWAALGGGVLTGKYTRGTPDDSLRAEMNGGRLSERNLHIARTVDAVADELGATSAQVALAWVRAQGLDMIPIVGIRKQSQLDDALGALDVTLSDCQRQRLNDVSQISLGFPMEFLGYDVIQDSVLGINRHKLDR